MSKRLRALMAAVATFAASWRFSNYTVRAGNHRNKETIKTKVEKVRTEVFLESIIPATMASDSANHDRATLVSSLVVRRVA